jgi:HEAT repeat protein
MEMSPASEKFLADIQSNDADLRYAAWARAGDTDPEVIPQLGKLLAASQPGVRKAAEEALKKIVHSVGRDSGDKRRAAVVRQLDGLLADGQANWTRTVALRQLSLLGEDETVPAAARLLSNAELQEEAAFCLERIPGKVSAAALMKALPTASDAFKPRILAALGHRRAEEAADLCAGAMGSPNTEVAMAAFKALARIGVKPAASAKPPEFKTLLGWQKIEFTDSVLRYADDQVRRGNKEEALKIYKEALQRPEEHLQCAAIVSLSKMETPEAAALIYTKLKSPNNTVRITAGKAWAAMKG